MYHHLQPKPLFVPLQKVSSEIFPSREKKYFIRAVLSSITAFLIAVILVSFATNHYEKKLREIQAAAATCQVSGQSKTDSAYRP